MGKEITSLPYFQFKPADWISGNIQFCSLEAKGLFSDICAFYWVRKCDMTNGELYRKYKEHNLLAELIKEEVIKIEDDQVVIEFLIDQYEVFFKLHKINVKNGQKGAEAKKQKRMLQEGLPVSPSSEKPAEVIEGRFFYVSTTLHKGRLSEFVQENFQIHIDQFMITMKPVTVKQVFAELDSRYNGGYQFNNFNHVKNTFDMIAKELKKGNGFKEQPTASKSSLNFGAK